MYTLHVLAARGELEKCRLVLEESKMNVNELDDLEWTPLMYAARYGHLHVVELLCQNGGSVTTTNIYGFSPLCMAVASNDELTFDYILLELLKHSKDSLKEERKAFELVCILGRIGFLRRLLQYDIFDVNGCNEFGVTPLLLTAYGGRFEECKILLKSGVNRSARNLMNQTAFDVSVYREDTKMQGLLYENNVPVLKSSPYPITPSVPQIFVFPSSPYISEPLKRCQNTDLNDIRLCEVEALSRNLLGSDNWQCGYLDGLISPRFFYSHEKKIKMCRSTSSIKQENFKEAKNKAKNRYLSWVKEKIVKKRRSKSASDGVFESDMTTNIPFELKIKNNLAITKLLTSLKLEAYISTFITNELDMDTILTLTESDLMRMRINEKEDRQNILKQIENYKFQNDIEIDSFYN